MATITDINDNVGRTLFGDINGVPESDTIYGLGGDDTINPKQNPYGFASFDYVDGGAGFDTLSVNASAETTGITFGAAGAVGEIAVRQYVGGHYYINAYNMESFSVQGTQSDDGFYTKSFTSGSIFGGGGIDYWEHDFSALSANISFSTKTVITGGTPGFFVTGIDRITLTTGAGNDTITGGDYPDTVVTGNGNDSVDAGKRPAGWAAYDYIDGGKGTDTWIASAVTETKPVSFFAGAGTTSWWLTAESDNFKVNANNMERVSFIGGSGDDTFDVTGAQGGSVEGYKGVDYLIADVSDVSSKIHYETVFFARLPGFSSISNIERINLKTGKGSDTIKGYKYSDVISTGAGNDIIDAQTHAKGSPNDVVNGGSGIDTLVLWAKGELSSTDITASLKSITSGNGKYGVTATGMDVADFHGGSGDDELTGGSRADELDGWEGNDVLNGGGGNDKRMYGWEGKDTLIGGTGMEKLYGGSGKDRFDFNSIKDSVVGSNRDQIRDFRRGEGDKIDLSSIDADTDHTPGNQKFIFIGSQKFHKVDGELRFSGHILAGDVNGDGRADFEIYVNVSSLKATDIVL